MATVGSPTLTGLLFGTLGVSLGLEPVNRYESILVNTGDQALDLIARIDEPDVFLHLDTYHMNIEKRGFREPIERAGDRLRCIYLSESDRATPGRGNVDWNGVFEGLAAIGHQGALVMESFAALNPGIARATCMWRDVIEDPEWLVSDGLSFLRTTVRRHVVLVDR